MTETLAASTAAMAAAAAAAAAAAIEDSSLNNNNMNSAEGNFNTTNALVSFLRMEADLAEEKARRLRQQAAALAQQFGVSEAHQVAYELDPCQMPPLDEHGIPKYKGKKRGRKPKPRKRKANPHRRKRQHTGYTLFMQETYPRIKDANPNFTSKDIIGMLAKQWKEAGPQEKSEWKARAKATHDEPLSSIGGIGHGAGLDDEEAAAAAAAAAAAVEDVDDDDDEEDDDDDDEDDDEEHDDDVDIDDEQDLEDEPAPPARRKKGKRNRELGESSTML